MGELNEMEEGQEIRWRSANGIRTGRIVDQFYRVRDKALLGYKVRMPDGKTVIVHPKSIITNQI